MQEVDLKQELVTQVLGKERQEVKLSKSMSIPDIVKALVPELKKELSSVITLERLTR